MSHTDGCFKLHIWNQLIRLPAMQQPLVFCHTCVVYVLSSFNASASLHVEGMSVPGLQVLILTLHPSLYIYLPASGLNNEVATPHLLQNGGNSVDLYGRPELLHTLSLLLHCRVICKHYSHLLLFIIVLKSLAEWKRFLFFWQGRCTYLPGPLSPLLSNVSPLLLLIRVNEMVPFTHPIWARPWNTPCFVKRWRGRTFDLQKPPDNYLFTYLCIYCWH